MPLSDEDGTMMKQQPQMISSNKKKEPDFECCGLHEVCEKESLRAVEGNIDYYEDEELDRFRGRTSYSEEEVEEFREVLYTMRPDEVAGWLHSLELRRVSLPDQLKDEAFLIIDELTQ